MKMYEVIKCKRMALGMTQSELADIAGVSANTISQFERGEVVHTATLKSIKYSVEEYINRLDDVNRYRVLLVSQALGLQYQIPQEQLRTLAYMNITNGNLSMAVMNTLNKERFL